MTRPIRHSAFLLALLLALGVSAPAARAQDDDPPSIAELMQQASGQLQQEDFAAAAKTLRQVVQRDKEQANGWQLLGFALHMDGQLDEAIKAHLKASEFEATKGVALYNLGCAYSLKKDKDKAFDYLEKAVAAGFDDVSYYETDTDLDSLRKDARFVRVMKLVRGEEVEPALDPAKLLGDWKYTAGKRAGEDVPEERLAGDVKVTKETFTLPAGPDSTFVMAYKLDAKKTPAAIDFEIKSGPVDEGSAKGVIKLIDKDTMQLCYDPNNAKRPEKFESTKENGFFLFTLKRK